MNEEVKEVSLRAAKAATKKYVELYLKMEKDQKKLESYASKIITYSEQNEFTGDIGDVKVYTKGKVEILGEEKDIKSFYRKLKSKYKTIVPKEIIPEQVKPRTILVDLKVIHKELKNGDEVLKELIESSNIEIKKNSKYYVKHQV